MARLGRLLLAAVLLLLLLLDDRTVVDAAKKKRKGAKKAKSLFNLPGMEQAEMCEGCIATITGICRAGSCFLSCIPDG